MKIFLAETSCCEVVRAKTLYALDTFAYINSSKPSDHRRFEDYLLDSGAFTFMRKGEIDKNFYEYVERYADYIKRNDIKHFFEMDVDAIIGYDEVLKIRKYLEKRTERPCIPVWHVWRGKEDFKRMCDEYDYVALGGFAGKTNIRWREYFPYLISEAHKRGAKIHGLGITSISLLQKLHFDTVDSTSWQQAGRFGQFCRFTGDGLEIRHVGKNETSILRGRKALAQAGLEWVKFQKYAKENM